jgi:hypothetical protein
LFDQPGATLQNWCTRVNGPPEPGEKEDSVPVTLLDDALPPAHVSSEVSDDIAVKFLAELNELASLP